MDSNTPQRKPLQWKRWFFRLDKRHIQSSQASWRSTSPEDKSDRMNCPALEKEE
jgi:hypothetical protein